MKYRLYAPGPTPVPEAVLLAMAHPVHHHRTAVSEEVMDKVRKGLRWVFQTEHEVLCLVGTGTAAMEASVCNFVSLGDTVLVVNAGKFGERFTDIARAYGVHVVEITAPWGQAVCVQKVQEALHAHPHAKALYVQACETSTGVLHPVAQIARVCAQTPTLCVVDGITAIGVEDIAQDRDHIDVLLSGSQKAFMLPPGLSFVGVSPRAWEAYARSTLPKFYFDLKKTYQAAQKNQGPFTSAVSLLRGLAVSLNMMQEEGLHNMFERHKHLALATREGVQALGCSLFADSPAHGLTAAWAPQGCNTDRMIQLLRDRWNITLGEGQDSVKSKIFRVAHMGYYDYLDVQTVLVALKDVIQSSTS
jgi:aspartate aminotransferase-like enzyme